jgi:hypothetical protein
MLFAIFIGIGFISAITAIIFKNKVAIIGSLAFIVISVIIPVCIYASNIGTIANMEAFYSASATNFQISRDDTASYLSMDKMLSNTALIPITGSIEKMGVGQSVADRILEYRNAINDYNSAFAQYRAYKRSLLFGIAYPSIPEQMRLLIVNPVENGSPNNIDSIETPPQSPAPDTDQIPVYTPTINENNDSNELNDAIDRLNRVIDKVQ